MSRIDGVTIAARRQRRALDAAEAFERQRESIYDEQPPKQERGLIVLAIVLIAGIGRGLWMAFA